MERPQSDLGSLAQDIISDLERVRPGWSIECTEQQIQQLAGIRAHTRLQELFQERYGDEGVNSETQLILYQREIEQILLPRYALLAKRKNQTELSTPRSWRGGALYNRLAYTLFFFLIGVFVVWAPFIPIWDKWIPFLLAALAPFISPVLPDIHQFIEKRRHEIAIFSLLSDVDQAGLALPDQPHPMELVDSRFQKSVDGKSTRE